MVTAEISVQFLLFSIELLKILVSTSYKTRANKKFPHMQNYGFKPIPYFILLVFERTQKIDNIINFLICKLYKCKQVNYNLDH